MVSTCQPTQMGSHYVRPLFLSLSLSLSLCVCVASSKPRIIWLTCVHSQSLELGCNPCTQLVMMQSTGRSIRWLQHSHNEMKWMARRPASHLLCAANPQRALLGSVMFLLQAAGVIKLVQDHYLSAHAHADELQVYGHVRPAQSLALMAWMANCITRIQLHCPWIWSRRWPRPVAGGMCVLLHLCLFRLTRRSLTTDTAHALVRALIHSCLNGLLLVQPVMLELFLVCFVIQTSHCCTSDSC